MTYRFNPPPTWPAPPEGWSPPPGWEPDPAWPTPPGWQIWIPEGDAPQPSAPVPQQSPYGPQATVPATGGGLFEAGAASKRSPRRRVWRASWR